MGGCVCIQFKQEHWVVVCAVSLNMNAGWLCTCSQFKQEHWVVVCAI